MVFHRDYTSVFLFHKVFWVGRKTSAVPGRSQYCHGTQAEVTVGICVCTCETCIHRKRLYIAPDCVYPGLSGISLETLEKTFLLMCFQLNSNAALQA